MDVDNLIRAKDWVEQLANGINPLTGEEVPEDDVVNNVRLSRCLFFVSKVLQCAIDDAEADMKSGDDDTAKTSFAITKSALRRYQFSDEPVTVSAISQQLNALIDSGTTKKLDDASITTFLMHNGLLAARDLPDGRSARRPTRDGKAIGITTQNRRDSSGEYTVVIYNRNAQEYILNHISEIAELSSRPFHDVPNQLESKT